MDELHLHSHILPYKLIVLVYLVLVSCIGAGVLVGIESGRTPLTYFDAFFITVNAMTATGLTPFNLTSSLRC
jgi:Trk-type K+ transport system membrane component